MAKKHANRWELLDSLITKAARTHLSQEIGGIHRMVVGTELLPPTIDSLLRSSDILLFDAEGEKRKVGVQVAKKACDKFADHVSMLWHGIRAESIDEQEYTERVEAVIELQNAASRLALAIAVLLLYVEPADYTAGGV